MTTTNLVLASNGSLRHSFGSGVQTLPRASQKASIEVAVHSGLLCNVRQQWSLMANACRRCGTSQKKRWSSNSSSDSGRPSVSAHQPLLCSNSQRSEWQPTKLHDIDGRSDDSWSPATSRISILTPCLLHQCICSWCAQHIFIMHVRSLVLVEVAQKRKQRPDSK